MFGLTRQEKTVILFLLGLAVIGIGVSFFSKQLKPFKEIPQLTSQKQKINLNTAGYPELISLPGIGPTLAARIIEYRSSHGAFLSAEDLKSVKGVSNRTLEQIKDQIVFE